MAHLIINVAERIASWTKKTQLFAHVVIGTTSPEMPCVSLISCMPFTIVLKVRVVSFSLRQPPVCLSFADVTLYNYAGERCQNNTTMTLVGGALCDACVLQGCWGAVPGAEFSCSMFATRAEFCTRFEGLEEECGTVVNTEAIQIRQL